ncbi:MAG: winged helix-turn-helix transcriptional regulator [Verrucomicrobia bacterium]|nr:winged helix-turn-helix transcriptional regulator [Verrucomicrobiota bacterium]
MLEGLFGNQTIQKVLLFLFVNGKCYGTQLHHALSVALTPVQKALLRLEKGGIVLSYFEGKTRLYQFNQAYPLLHELEQLLKKAYTLLPIHEKKNYFLLREPPLGDALTYKNAMSVLLQCWERLMSVKTLSFHAKTKMDEANGWNGRGQGEVMVIKEQSHVLIFQEKGAWQGKEAAEVSFSNIFRWTLDRQTGVISLEHLRHGVEHPVFLFYLAPCNQNLLASLDSHLYEGDAYFGQVYLDSVGLRLKWRVIGPKKNEEIDYFYF